MARNQRIFYACQAVAVTPRGTAPTAAYVVHGLQSVGMSSTFTLEQIFEMGQLEIYENVEEVADIEVTLEKVLDGYKLIYDLASQGACKTDLAAAAKSRCDCWVAVFDDGLSNATGVPRNVCMNSGLFISSVSYNYSVDGNATESVTLVGNDRFWNSTTAGVIGTSPTAGWTANPTTNIDYYLWLKPQSELDGPCLGFSNSYQIQKNAGEFDLTYLLKLWENGNPELKKC